MSISDQPPSDTLAALYGPLVAKAAASRALCGARVQLLDEAIREASMWSSRRAAGHARDRSCYRLGAALEPAGGLSWTCPGKVESSLEMKGELDDEAEAFYERV